METLELRCTLTGKSEWLFPGDWNEKKYMSNNTILKALERMGYKGRMTGHGFRGLASTILHEQGYAHEHIELQFAHAPRSAASAAYMRGDPMRTLLWASKSLRHLSEALQGQGHSVCPNVVGDCLHDLGYSVQTNRKTREGSDHVDRNAQFEYLNEKATEFLKSNEPVISVDTKKKELVGYYKNNGREWHPKANPDEVDVHDFIDPKSGRAVPYGIYDVGDNKGWVSVGSDHDTASFAVQAILRWWQAMGQVRYPQASRLLISADGGGNGHRVRLWKVEL